ncbi:peptide-methionine (R)-S-oxide reductase MsrB [Daejeonella oryzae]|uniref:peptide-methionine (R)-S-oxide reductase MsrB n=1 Tax=Daejeonella oryzae TaxID=1122943 RepID=UPI00047BE1FE|nr:peptide-methionine (R)-S-oxide reductase MsrB [Daejeonella oryzae]
MKNIVCISAALLFMIGTSCGQSAKTAKKENSNSKKFPIEKSENEWKKILSPIAFEVMVKKGTETPFKNPYNSNYQKGIYVSAATGEPLFSSEDKFDSGTGWPSFTKPINPKAVTVVQDNSLGMVRGEIIETSTGLHLGHVFDDGPADKGGKRYCMNSAAFKFIKK